MEQLDMFLASKKYSRKGRYRYGSAVFVDDVNEELIEVISGQKKKIALLLIILFETALKLISSDIIGLIYITIILYLAYYSTIQNVHMSFTKHRMLMVEEYRYPRIVMMIGILLIISSLIALIRVLIHPEVFFSNLNLRIVESILYSIGLRNFVFYRYNIFISNNLSDLNIIDNSINTLILFWLGIHYIRSRYSFQEVHYSHISEQLISVNQDASFIVTSLFFIFSISLIIISQTFNLVIVLAMFITYRYLPENQVSNLSLFGFSGRNIVSKIQIPPPEYRKLTLTTASIFQWTPQGDYSSRPFPYNIIPNEVASHYETGLRASIIPALKQGNKVGLAISSIINILVILGLLNFALNYNKQSLSAVLLLTLIIIGFSAAIWFFLNFLNRYRLILQSEEALMIGQGFIGRYIDPALWILKGSHIEGTRVQRGVSQRLIRFDKTKGIIIAWRRLSLYIILLIISSFLAIWISLGGLNPTNVWFIFPFLFDRSLEFLSDKANAELSFFILAGYAIWIILYLNYPRIYAFSRPQLFLEIQYPVTIPIILKDFVDHQDASIELSKTIVYSSRPRRRGSIGRPGCFTIDIFITKMEIPEKILNRFYGFYFEFGDMLSMSKTFVFRSLINSKDERRTLFNYLRVSAEAGYPRVPVSIVLLDQNRNRVQLYNEVDDLHPKNTTTRVIRTKFGLSFSLEYMVRHSRH
ncbi:MAG: hypothetical protein ACXAB7_11590 [Candidatus Kariarchaeaceae archaeon]|jgi:hypothetical protein